MSPKDENQRYHSFLSEEYSLSQWLDKRIRVWFLSQTYSHESEVSEFVGSEVSLEGLPRTWRLETSKVRDDHLGAVPKPG